MSSQPDLAETTQAQPFDVKALHSYLSEKIDGITAPLDLTQFTAGQSNPTFKITSGDTSFVLRKKPSGDLLPSAHAVDREYRVMAALQDTNVPVPKMLHLCDDPSIIGTDFYVMEMVEGDVFQDPSLPSLTVPERRAFYDSFIRALAALHSVVPEDVGLGSFGRAAGFISRQVSRWSKQYKATETEHIDAMEQLIKWLPENLPDENETAIVHGDFRPGNVIADSKTQEIKALLDWELCTLGHPLADIGYVCALFHADVLPTGRLKGLDHTALGIPTEQEFLDLYCKYAGRERIEDHLFFVAFSLFRSAAIIQGVYKRGLDGNAASEKALKLGHLARLRAETAWNVVTENL